MKKVAGMIFENDKKQILLLLRDNKPNIPFPNTWDMIGWHVEDDETFEEALVREVQEEIEIDLKQQEYTFFREYFCPSTKDAYENIKHIYYGKINIPVEEIRLHEWQRVQYFDYDEIMGLECANMTKEIFLEYMNATKI
ncbi:MAG: hypothetical protein ACD_80C00011G0016 [uncultured bacterium (gcode 4)]|uniref:Nudix hydrolase domain-containing protein n=1 Tax=uncultured bacterium (gcode 4) TaxID=1234023 RepID=K1YJY7_9BACT|nr:MAG: hypothetical protein ACD_80C00011G0016 [uncultured bacterium (gcode 4)]